MKTYKTIPFHILLIRSLAEDFENKDMTWRELYAILFEEGTDIHREFVVTLVDSNIKLDSKINYKQTIEDTQGSIVMFEAYMDQRILRNLVYREDYKIPKTVTVNVLLSRLGYSIIKQKK